MAAQPLEEVLNHPAVWRGIECARVAVASVPTGFAELDAVLPGGGWPAGALTEIHCERPGAGELQLVMPAAARLTQSGRWLALIAPPYIPYAPALVSHGVRLSRVMLVRTPAAEESLWACGQALRSHGCGAVLTWLERAPEHSFRRLQLAVENNDALALLFRPGRAVPASPAALRLHVSKSQSRTLVRVLKRRGSDVPAPIALDLHGRPAERAAPARVAVPLPLLPEGSPGIREACFEPANTRRDAARRGPGCPQSSRSGGSPIEEPA